VAAAPDSAEPIVLDEAPIVSPASSETDEASGYEADDALYGETASIEEQNDEGGYPEDEYRYGYDREQYSYDDVEYDDVETSSDVDGYYEDELSLSTDDFSAEDASADDQYEDVYDEYQYGEDDDSVADDGSGSVEPGHAAAAEAGDVQGDNSAGAATDTRVEDENDEYSYDGTVEYDEEDYSQYKDSYNDPSEESSSHAEYPYDDGFGEDSRQARDDASSSGGWPSDSNDEHLDVDPSAEGQAGAPDDSDGETTTDESLWQGCDTYPNVETRNVENSSHEMTTMIDAAWRSVRHFVVSLPAHFDRLTK
ncbi:MAG: hypothetical protein IIA67_10035, partial [Planctomycetes bacterium]|nr:hypothetical protein [Planctomycetota bacterium]